MQSIYISGPLTTHGDREENVKKAAKVAASYLSEGYAVFCPHIYDIVDKATDKVQIEYDQWMMQDLHWLAKCDTVVMLPGWQDSNGSVIEHMTAHALSKNVIYWQGRADA